MAGKIFINYRREDSIAIAGRLHDRLAEAFGRDNLFMDIDNIPIGINFYEYLKSEMADCDAVLSVIGPNWLNAKDDTGQRRLDKPDDFVAIEISIALAGDILVVPVLVDGTRMPGASELPSSLKPFALRNAIQVRNTSFGSDAEQLIKKMREAFALGRPERSKGKANLLLFAAQGVASFLLSIAAFFIVLGFFLLLPGLYSRIGYNFTGGVAALTMFLVMWYVGLFTLSLDKRVRKFGLAIAVAGFLTMVAVIVYASFFLVSPLVGSFLQVGCLPTAIGFGLCAWFFGITWKKLTGAFNKREEARWMQHEPRALRLANSWSYWLVTSSLHMSFLMATWAILLDLTDSPAAVFALVGLQLLLTGYCYYRYTQIRKMLTANPGWPYPGWP
jgi:hypothetical protein